MSDLACQLTALHVHPVKSCAGMAVNEALLVETGLDLDRAWMVVDAHGDMLTQRTLPRLALVQPTFKGSEMVLRAPGMLALHVRLDTVEAATRVRVWDDIVKAYDMGVLAAQWFSDFIGRDAGALRLVRFDPEQQRLADPQWTGELRAEVLLAGGGGDLAVLDQAMRSIESVSMDVTARQRYTVRILTQALDVVTSGNAAGLGAASSRPAATVGSHPATEAGLRDGLERAYRALARDAPLLEDRVGLVNKANEVRSWTLT